MIRTKLLAATTLAAALAVTGTAGAEGDGASAGYLRCDVSGAVSFIFGSTRDVTCTYEPVGDAPVQNYVGEIERYGIDIGYMESSVMIWGVATGGEDVPDGGLAGKYAGVSTEIAAGLGVGVNALVLGEKSLALQPLSIEGGTGLNLAAGVAELELRKAE